MLLTLLLTAFTFILGSVGFVLLLLETIEGLFQSAIHLFLRRLTGLYLFVFLTRLVTFVIRIYFRSVVLDALAFTTLCRRLLLCLLSRLTLFALFALFLFGFLSRTCRSVDGVEVDFAEHFRCILQLRFTEREDLLFRFLFYGFLHFFRCSLCLLSLFSGFCCFGSRSLFCRSFLCRSFLCRNTLLLPFGFLFRLSGSRFFFGFLRGLRSRFIGFFARLTFRCQTIRFYLHRHIFVKLFGEHEIEIVVDTYVRVRLYGMAVLLAPCSESSHTDI